MSKFYYTYGTAESFPFRGGWTLIEAPNSTIANAVFKTIHPNPDPESYLLNCADRYTEEAFQKTNMYTANSNLGAGEHERITVTVDRHTEQPNN